MMEQDKNFTVRLKAAIERRMRETGVIDHMITPPDNYSSKEKKQLWAFMESLETISIEYLQGQQPPELNLIDAVILDMRKGDRFKFNYDIYLVTRKYIDDDRPLIAREESTNARHIFDWEGLEIKKILQ